MRKIDPFILIIGIFILLVVIGGVFVAYNTSKPQSLTSYSATASERPTLQLSTNHVDFGQTKVSEIKTADIVLENTGTKPLEITNVSTSCDCTFAQIEIAGKKSPRFTMHQNPKWLGKVEPGSAAKLTAIYEPAKMPVQGPVERVIFFTTNDPTNPKVEILISATVS